MVCQVYVSHPFERKKSCSFLVEEDLIVDEFLNLVEEKWPFLASSSSASASDASYYLTCASNRNRRMDDGQATLMSFFPQPDNSISNSNDVDELASSSRDANVSSSSYFPLFLDIYVPTLGGKGGFGSMLRAEGKRAAAKKTTNFEATRDLATGRLLRTVHDAEKLAEFIEKAPQRKRAEKLKLEKKLEALKKSDQGAQERRGNAKVDNSQFLKEKEEVLEGIDDAILKALKKAPASALSVSKKSSASASSAKAVVIKKKSAAFADDDSD